MNLSSYSLAPEELQQFSAQTVFELYEARGVASRPRHALDEPGAAGSKRRPGKCAKLCRKPKPLKDQANPC